MIGAIDCTHVRIQKPHEHGDEYINRRNWPSINVQAVCDSNCKYWNAVISWPGSVHDARIFANSELSHQLENREIDGILLDDAGYALKPYPLTPYRNPATPVQRNFNATHSRTRVCVERSFCILKRRFACLYRGLQIPLERVPVVVLVCIKLHNMCIAWNEPVPEPEEDFSDEIENVHYERHGRVQEVRARDIIAHAIYDQR